jgi:hypothetical protein
MFSCFYNVKGYILNSSDVTLFNTWWFTFVTIFCTEVVYLNILFGIKYNVIAVSPCSGPDDILCMDQETRCFNNVTQRCNGERDCMSGLDEKDCNKCPGEYACHSGEVCYKYHQLCDNKVDCSDYSDEMTCLSY